MAWFSAPLFGPVLAMTITFLPSGLLVVIHILHLPSDSETFFSGGPMLNLGTVNDRIMQTNINSNEGH